MRKLIAFILIAALMITGAVMPASAADNYALNKAVSLLAELDILRGDGNGNFLLDKNVTRAEFTAFVIRMLNLEMMYSGAESTFSDVPESHWASGVISSATSLNLVNGMDNGTFEPDRTVTMNEAMKIIVCALGYGKSAEADGGYPGGYVHIATKLNLYKNITNISGVIDRATVCLLLYNTLFAKSYDEISDSADKTFMEVNLGLTTVNGVVTATPMYQTNVELDSDEVMIDGKVYKNLFDGADSYIGCEVVCYIQSERDVRTVRFIEGYSDARTVTVLAEDICPETTINKFVYYENNAKVNLSLAPTLNVFYNGEAVAPGEINRNLIVPQIGSVTLKSGNGGAYDTILIEVYDDYVVRYISDDIIYGKFGKKLDLTDAKDVKILKDGKEITIDELQNGDVLSAMQNRDGSKAKIYVCDKSADGYITGTELIYGNRYKYNFSSDSEITFRINKSYEDALVQSHYDTIKLSINSSKKLRIYYNSFGFVADVTQISGEDEYTYGYLMTAKALNQGFEDTVSFRILTLANRFEVFKTKSGSKIKFGRPSGGNYVITSEDAATVARGLSSKQVIKYKLDDEGYIKEIYKADPNRSNEHFSKGPEDGTLLTYRDGVFNSKYYIDQNTAVFSTNSAYEHIMAAGKYTAFLNNGAAKYCTFYDLEGSYAKVLLMNAPGVTVYEDNERTGYEIIIDPVNSPIFYINSITTVSAEDGESYMRLVGFQDGEPKELLVADNLKANSEPRSNLRAGIAIQYEDNALNRERALTSDELPQMILYKTVYDFTAPLAADIFWEYEKVKSTRSQITTMWGNVVSMKDNYCTLSIGDELYTSNVHQYTMVLHYDRLNNKFEQVTAEHINTNQNVFIRQRYQNTREVVIY